MLLVLSVVQVIREVQNSVIKIWRKQRVYVPK